MYTDDSSDDELLLATLIVATAADCTDSEEDTPPTNRNSKRKRQEIQQPSILERLLTQGRPSPAHKRILPPPSPPLIQIDVDNIEDSRELTAADDSYEIKDKAEQSPGQVVKKSEESEDTFGHEDPNPVHTESDGEAVQSRSCRRRFVWVQEELKKRDEEGRLATELSMDDGIFYELFKMSKEAFERLHSLIEKDIYKHHTNWRKPIPTRQRLGIYLRYLAVGGASTCLNVDYKLGRSTVFCIVEQVSEVIWNILQPLIMPAPTSESWLEMAKEFESQWGFPNCIGVIDGKHAITACNRNKDDTSYLQLLKMSSLVLLSIIDANYRFVMVDIGNYGLNTSDEVLDVSLIGQKLASGELDIPPPMPVPGGEEILPCVLLGDETFTLRKNLMCPFSKAKAANDRALQNYNDYIHSVRSIVNVTYNMMADRWKVFREPFYVNHKKMSIIVRSACCLHNFILSFDNNFLPVDVSANSYPPVFEAIYSSGRRGRNAAMAARDSFSRYFNTLEGGIKVGTDC